MSKGLDRFLSHRTHHSQRASLGRIFTVTCETWGLKDDPKAVAPKVSVVASRRTAAEAADIAREAAAAFRRRGFHKPQRAWWGADETHFHRYLVHGPKRRPALTMLVLGGLAAGVAVALTRRRDGESED